MLIQEMTAEEGSWEGSLQGHVHSLGGVGSRVLGAPGGRGQTSPLVSHQAAPASWNPSVQSAWPQKAAMGAREGGEWLSPRTRLSSPGGLPQQRLQGQGPGAGNGGQKAKAMPERPQLSPEQSVLLQQRGQPALEGRVIETPLLPGPLGRLVVLPPLLPVNRVLLLFRHELTLPPHDRAPAPQGLAATLRYNWKA